MSNRVVADLKLHTMLYRYMQQPGRRWKATNDDIVEHHPDGGKRAWPFSIPEIEEVCPDMSREMARLALRAMKVERLIASTSKGRGAKWVKPDTAR